eukprot:jgi/Botrbrau1/16812/Bobra.150_2s0039.1
MPSRPLQTSDGDRDLDMASPWLLLKSTTYFKVWLQSVYVLKNLVAISGARLKRRNWQSNYLRCQFGVHEGLETDGATMAEPQVITLLVNGTQPESINVKVSLHSEHKDVFWNTPSEC